MCESTDISNVITIYTHVGTSKLCKKLEIAEKESSGVYYIKSKELVDLFSIEDGNYVYMSSNKDCAIGIVNAEYAPYADIGHFEGEDFVAEEKAYPTDKLYLSKGKLYRIKITKIINEVTSTTDDNV